MPFGGRKKHEAEEALVSAKNLIIKVKKMGIVTSEAEEQYLKAKELYINKKYGPALEGLAEAKKKAKESYAKGLKDILEARIRELEKNLNEMESYGLDTAALRKRLKGAKNSLSEGVSEHREAYKDVKEAIKKAKETRATFRTISNMLTEVRGQLEEMRMFDKKIAILADFEKKLLIITQYLENKKLKASKIHLEKLKKEVYLEGRRFKQARDRILAFEKTMNDAKVLDANYDFQESFEKAQDLMRNSRFSEAKSVAGHHLKMINEQLAHFKEIKHEIDIAEDKIKEVKGWGFSPLDAEEMFNRAKEALRNHDFENARILSQKSREMAVDIRARHKQSLELLNQAKERIEKLKSEGKDISFFETEVSEAETLFNKGDYGSSIKRLNSLIGELRGNK